MRYDSADNYQAGANAVISNLSASHKSWAEDGDDVGYPQNGGRTCGRLAMGIQPQLLYRR